MQIQCECGKFSAELTKFPENTPGRLMCYCDDCQIYLHHLGRADLFDPVGGTEIVPVYPSEIRFVNGQELLKALRLSPNGMFRWSTTCCNTPVANTRHQMPYVGVFSRVYNVQDASYLAKVLGPIKSRIHGKFVQGPTPVGTSKKLGVKDIRAVLPFMLTSSTKSTGLIKSV